MRLWELLSNISEISAGTLFEFADQSIDKFPGFHQFISLFKSRSAIEQSDNLITASINAYPLSHRDRDDLKIRVDLQIKITPQRGEGYAEFFVNNNREQSIYFDPTADEYQLHSEIMRVVNGMVSKFQKKQAGGY